MADPASTALVAAGAAIRTAMAVGVVSLCVALLLLLVAAAVRCWRARTARRDERARRRWLPVFLAAVHGRGDPPGTMPARERTAAVEVWNHLMSTVSGDGGRRLRQCGQDLGLAGSSRRKLARGRSRARLGAVVALGHLGDRPSWDRLVVLLDDANSGIRIDAARALVRIDGTEAVGLLLPRFLDSERWYRSAAVSVLGEADPARVGPALDAGIAAAPPAGRRQLARILGGLRSPAALAGVRRLMTEAGDDHELLSACLDALAGCGEPADAAVVRPLLDHPAWFVRLKAVTAIGRLGGPEDLGPLNRLLSDREWWVRYRSAQAVSSIAGLGADELERLRLAHPDPFARDAVAQVLAESEGAAA